MLRSILTQVWDDLAGARMLDAEVQSNLDICMALIPREDEGPWIMEQAAAEDAATAVAYTLRCRQSGSAQEAAWSAGRPYEALDHYVINIENVDMTKPGAEERVLAHSLVQAELARQRRDLDEVLGAADRDIRELAKRLRDRAVAEAAVFFGGVGLR